MSGLAGSDLRLIGAGFAQEKVILFAQDLDSTVIPKCWDARRAGKTVTGELSVSFNGREFSAGSGLERKGEGTANTSSTETLQCYLGRRLYRSFVEEQLVAVVIERGRKYCTDLITGTCCSLGPSNAFINIVCNFA